MVQISAPEASIFYSQALAKVSRAHAHDLRDVAAMVQTRRVFPARPGALAEQVAAAMARYPDLDASALFGRVRAWAADAGA